jgi:integrase
MKLVKKARSPFWWFDFRFQGKRYRGSTGEKSKSAANTVAAKTLSRLTEGRSINKRTDKAPTLREYANTHFLPWVLNANSLKPSTSKYYQYGWRLLADTKLASTPINQISKDLIDTTKFHRDVLDRKGKGKAVKGQPKPKTGERVECSEAYKQQALRTLRVMLGRAWEDREMRKVLKERTSFSIAKTPGRDMLIDQEAEASIERELTGKRGRARARYRAWLVTMIMQDTGMRPSEVFEIRLENIRWADHRIWIPSGKTARARRFVGMSDRMHLGISTWCRGDAGPGWLFPSRSKTGHIQSIGGSFKTARDGAGLDRRLVSSSTASSVVRIATLKSILDTSP